MTERRTGNFNHWQNVLQVWSILLMMSCDRIPRMTGRTLRYRKLLFHDAAPWREMICLVWLWQSRLSNSQYRRYFVFIKKINQIGQSLTWVYMNYRRIIHHQSSSHAHTRANADVHAPNNCKWLRPGTRMEGMMKLTTFLGPLLSFQDYKTSFAWTVFTGECSENRRP